MRDCIARRLYDTLGLTVYTEEVPQHLTVPSVSVLHESTVFEGMQDGWCVNKSEFRLILRGVEPCAVAEVLQFVTDREGQRYTASEMRAEGDFFITIRYRTRVTEERDPAPLMQTMKQKTEV